MTQQEWDEASDEERKAEIQRCKDDPHYFYITYWRTGIEPPNMTENAKAFFDWWQKIVENPNIKGVILKK